jgi:hypothetical protein
MGKKKILVIGQTPPPFHGQAISTKSFLEGNYSQLRLYHIRLSFSSSIDQIGRFTFYKMWHLLEIVVKIYLFKIRYGIHALYYIPVGNRTIPFYRDAFILLSSEWLIAEIFFHFRVG